MAQSQILSCKNLKVATQTHFLLRNNLLEFRRRDPGGSARSTRRGEARATPAGRTTLQNGRCARVDCQRKANLCAFVLYRGRKRLFKRLFLKKANFTATERGKRALCVYFADLNASIENRRQKIDWLSTMKADSFQERSIFEKWRAQPQIVIFL